MSDQNQSNPPAGAESAAGDILSELRELGNNLGNLLQAAWESEDRKKIQQEIETGLNDVNKALRDLGSSETGQAIKADLRDINERLRSGEIEQRVRSEVTAALRAANEGLKKAMASKTPPEPPKQAG